jgi:hypothetical protein
VETRPIKNIEENHGHIREEKRKAICIQDVIHSNLSASDLEVSGTHPVQAINQINGLRLPGSSTARP